MTHSFIYYISQIGLCLFGSFCYIAYLFKIEGDKFENKRSDFDDKKFARKNKWDFGFYIAAGLGILTVKSVVRSETGIEEISDYGLSYVCGLLGSVAIEKILNKT